MTSFLFLMTSAKIGVSSVDYTLVKTQPINNQYFPHSLSGVQVLTSLWNQSYAFTVGNTLWKRGTLESLIAESNSYLYQYHKALLNMLQLYMLLTE